MAGERLIVLKFGGSVLRDEPALRDIVHEIRRWRRDGSRVLAVVSALAGRTDALLAQCRDLAECDAGAHAAAAHLANGEHECASQLGVLLERAGVASATLAPAAIGLRARGPALDADPVAVHAGLLAATLARCGVVVVPGFVAVGDDGRTALLGRGGSDLTALFLAHALRAERCRLVKDVDGLYDRDPAAPGPRARRYAQATWADALATDGSILQHKAVRFARSHGLRFEVGAMGGDAPTLVGARRTVFSDEAAAPPRGAARREAPSEPARRRARA